MLSNRLAKAVLLAGVLQSGLVNALGVGEISLKSSLNQPLEASIPLRDVGELSEAEIIVKLADRATYVESGVDRPQFLSKLNFSVEVNDRGTSQIRVSTSDPVVEPYLDFIVELRWPSGRMLREYTLLLDLPQYGGDSTPVQAAQRSAPVPVQPQPQGETDASDAGAAAKKSEVVEPGGARGPAAPTAPEARPETQQTALPPAEDPDEYRIQHNDTMWRLGERFRPSALVTTQQTMIAIYNKNPDAFIGNNINQIKSGYVLRLPSESEVQAVDPYQAIQDIRVQNRRWRGEAPASPAAGAATTPSAPQVDATKTAEPTGPAAEATEGGRFSLSAGTEGSGGDGNVADLERRLQEEREALEKVQLENQSMQSRVAEMETQIDTLQKLIALKNRQLAALQSGVSEGALAEADQQDLQSADASDAAQQDASGAAQQVAEPDTAGDTGMQDPGAGSESAESAGEPAANADDAQADQPAASAPTATDSAEPWYSNRMLQMVLGGLVILLLLVLALRQRAKEREDDDSLSDEPVIAGDNTGFVGAQDDDGAGFDFDQLNDAPTGDSDDSDESAVFSAAASTNLDDLDFDDTDGDSSPAESRADWEQSASWETAAETTAESVQPQTDDVMSEAEIYVAYGRYDQASSLLKNAIALDPDNTALRVKLIDLYLDTRDRDNFQQAFAELKALGDEQAVARVKESMSAIEGVSDWLDESPRGEQSTAAASLDALDDELAFLDGDSSFDEPGDSQDDSEVFSDLAESGLADSSGLTDIDGGATDDNAEPEQESASADEAGPSAEFDPQLDDSFAATLEDTSLEGAGDSAFELDFDEVARDADEHDAAPDLDLDSDFDIGDLDAVAEEPAEAADNDSEVAGETPSEDAEQTSLDDNGAEEELELDLSEFDVETPDDADAKPIEATTEDNDLSELDMDLSDFNFDSDENTEIDVPAAAQDSPVAEAPSEGADSDTGHAPVADVDFDLDTDIGDFADFSEDSVNESDSEASDASPAMEKDQPESVSGDQGEDINFEDDGSEEALNALMEAADAEADGELSADYADELMQTQDDTSMPPASESSQSESSPTVSDDDSELDVEELVFDEFDADPEGADGGDFGLGSDAEEVATKLDLARAYVDMGDKEGAREILDEVLQEGDDAQRSEAQGLIDQL